MKKQRSARVVMTDEARVMRDLRIRESLSMKAAGKLIGVSDSYISHIENGRVEIPTSHSLLRFLKAYGRVTPKYFGELVREKRQEVTDLDIINDLLERLKPHQIKAVRAFIEQLMQGN